MERGVIQSRRQLPGVRRRRLQLAHQRRKLWMHWTRLCVAPNGSRLSCGRSLGGRAAGLVDRRYWTGAQMEFYPTLARPAASRAC